MYFWKNYEVREEVAKIIKVGSILQNENPERKGQFIFDENSSNAQYAYIDSSKNKNRIDVSDYLMPFQFLSKEIIKPENAFILPIPRRNKKTVSLTSFLLNKLYSFFISDEDFSKGFMPPLSKKNNEISGTLIGINSTGSVASLITETNTIIILNIKKNPWKVNAIYPSIKNELLTSFTFHPLNPNSFLFTTPTSITVYKFNDNSSAISIPVNFSHIIQGAYFPNGQFISVLSLSSLSIIDAFTYETVYSKNYLLKRFTSMTISPDSSFIILTTSSSELYIINTFNYDFKSYSEFPGEIAHIEISNNSNYIFVFITTNTEVLMYILYNEREDHYNVKPLMSYNNTYLSYVHSKFKMYYNVYSIVDINPNESVDIKMSLSNTRLLVSYQSPISNKRTCTLYELSYGDGLHQFRMKVMNNIEGIEGNEIKNIEMGYDVEKKRDVVICNWNDQYLHRFYIGNEK